MLILSVTKLDESFPSMQSNIDGYNTFRSDQDTNGGSILVYVRDDTPCNLIPMRNSTIEGFFIELNLKKNGSCAVPTTLIEDLFPTIWLILGRTLIYQLIRIISS